MLQVRAPWCCRNTTWLFGNGFVLTPRLRAGMTMFRTDGAVAPPEKARHVQALPGSWSRDRPSKIEAAFSPGGTMQVPAVICYEGIYVRDHWRRLTSHPWWYAQIAGRRAAAGPAAMSSSGPARTGSSFRRSCRASSANRCASRSRPARSCRLDRRTDRRERLVRAADRRLGPDCPLLGSARQPRR